MDRAGYRPRGGSGWGLSYPSQEEVAGDVRQGAVIRQDADLRKQIPIADVEISTANVFGASTCKSDASGFFWLELPAGIAPGQSVTLLFRHPGYHSLELNAVAGDKIYVARMIPDSREASDAKDHPDIVVANVDVRYSIKSTAVANVGSVVKTFQAVSKGNVPCNDRSPCSPDTKWKAAFGYAGVQKRWNSDAAAVAGAGNAAVAPSSVDGERSRDSARRSGVPALLFRLPWRCCGQRWLGA